MSTAGSSTSHSPDDKPPTLLSRNKQERGIRKDVRPPFMRVSFPMFLNILTALLVAFIGWYIYHAIALTFGMARDAPAGSMNPLWPLGFGRSSSGSSSRGGDVKAKMAEQGAKMDVEGHIAALAEELGMKKDSDLAIAIAEAVREHVPPASLSALSARAQETGGSRVVDALVGEGSPSSNGAAGAVAETIGKVVGMDDAPAGGLD